MVFNDVDDIVYRTFVYDFHSHKLTKWKEYIQSKNLGIKHIENVFNSQTFLNSSIYEIVDQKKWLLAKIKYGF